MLENLKAKFTYGMIASIPASIACALPVLASGETTTPDITTQVTTAATNAATQATGVVNGLFPIVLGVATTIIVVKVGLRLFKSFTNRAAS